MSKILDKLKTFDGYLSLEEVNSDIDLVKEEFLKLQHQLEIQTKRVENLKKGLAVYECDSRWSHGRNQLEPIFSLIGNETDAKLFAKRAITIDQELEKELGNLK